MTPLFVVRDVFQVENRGCILAPGLSLAPDAPIVKAGAWLRICIPDGRQLDSFLRGLESPHGPDPTKAAILLADITKDQVPIGSEVFLLDSTT